MTQPNMTIVEFAKNVLGFDLTEEQEAKLVTFAKGGTVTFSKDEDGAMLLEITAKYHNYKG